MKIHTGRFIAGVAAVTVIFSFNLATAYGSSPLTPEYAAKKENFRKQKEQQITPEKKKAAAESLKAERVRVYRAKQAAKQAKPGKQDHN